MIASARVLRRIMNHEHEGAHGCEGEDDVDGVSVGGLDDDNDDEEETDEMMMVVMMMT